MLGVAGGLLFFSMLGPAACQQDLFFLAASLALKSLIQQQDKASLPLFNARQPFSRMMFTH